MNQNHYDSVQNLELYVILKGLKDFKETLNIVANSQYAERIVLPVETTEFIPTDTNFTLLFIRV